MKSSTLSKPHIIVMLGVPGSGKTFFAEQFSNTLQAPFVHYDKIVELSGSSAAVARKLAYYQLGELLKTKQSLIVEGMADSRADRLVLMKKAEAIGYAVLFVWVQTDPDTAKQRATKSSTRSTKQMITTEEYDQLIRRFVPPTAAETTVVLSGKHTYASQSKIVLSRISQISQPKMAQPAEIEVVAVAVTTRSPKTVSAASVKPTGRKKNITIR